MVVLIYFCLLAFVLFSCCASACCICLLSLQPGDLPCLIWCLIIYLLYCMIQLSEMILKCYSGRLCLFEADSSSEWP